MEPGAKNRILVIDDDLMLRQLIHAILAHSGYEVDLAESGNHGLKRLKEKSYDVIISDVNMPEMDGLSLYGRIKKDLPWLKNRMLFLTGDSKNETLLFFMENGCRYLSKPFRGPELLVEVGAILNKEISYVRKSYLSEL